MSQYKDKGLKDLDLFFEHQKRFLLTPYGFDFYKKFLGTSGIHCFIIGQTGSGKTQKMLWLASYLCKTETVVWIETGKNDEFLPLFLMGKPVRIICPENTDLIFHNVKSEYQPEIVHVSRASSAWIAVKKGAINVFAFRNTIDDVEKRAEWMSYLFSSLGKMVRLKRLDIFPCTIFGDEAQWFASSKKVSTQSARRRASEYVVENALEIRGIGGRMVLAAQAYNNIPTAARENLNATMICRNAFIKAGDNPHLSAHTKWCSYYRPKDGLFVFPDYSINPTDRPWTFPFFGSVWLGSFIRWKLIDPLEWKFDSSHKKVWVEYSGFHDKPKPVIKISPFQIPAEALEMVHDA